MDRIKRWFKQSQTQAYTALPSDPESPPAGGAAPVSRLHYFIFLLLGCAMLWSWNMFMACATYFQRRFSGNDFLLNNFQPLILVSSTATNLASSYLLSRRQATADYPRRIWTSLLMNCALTAVLAASTVVWVVGPESYIVVVLLCVVAAAWSTGLSQNGVFAFVNTFGGMYMQAVMTGQAVAGVLPAIAQILSILLVPAKTDNDAAAADDNTQGARSAFLYFLTATFVSGLTLLLFLLLLSQRPTPHKLPTDDLTPAPLEAPPPPPPPHRTEVPLWTLFTKLRYLSIALWLTFFVTMAFPVYTQLIVSVRPQTPSTPRLFTPDVFIPFSFLVWNLGDLTGRVLCGFPRLTLTRPRLLAAVALARVLFVPAYMACNVRGEGALVDSDLAYWLLGFLFGVSSGWVGSCAMMRAPECVDEGEREACGGFMGLCLVVGLASGSLASFVLTGA